MFRSPFFSFMSLSLLVTVDIMSLSLCCFAIIMLIEGGEEGPNGPPAATPGPATGGARFAEPISQAVVANAGPVAKTAAAKRPLQVDLDADPDPQAGKRSKSGRTKSSAISSD